jgi:hypothetical protein
MIIKECGRERSSGNLGDLDIREIFAQPINVMGQRLTESEALPFHTQPDLLQCAVPVLIGILSR